MPSEDVPLRNRFSFLRQGQSVRVREGTGPDAPISRGVFLGAYDMYGAVVDLSEQDRVIGVRDPCCIFADEIVPPAPPKRDIAEEGSTKRRLRLDSDDPIRME